MAASHIVLFFGGAAVSLSTSWFLVSRLAMVGERLHLSEGLLGIVAAVAADAPELTAAITALFHRQHTVGSGVVLGSNVFNLAALLGLGALVAGRIRLHRRVILLGGALAVPIAAISLAAVVHAVAPLFALIVGVVAVVLYAIVLGEGRGLSRVRWASRWTRWLGTAVAEEEAELGVALRPRPAGPADAVVAVLALAVVVAASAAMERAASALGRRWGIADIVLGGLVLAAVTSLPNAVAAIYLAANGRGAAALSTTLNSNAINATAGLLAPATALGIGAASSPTTLVGAWYVGMTVCILALAFRHRALHRSDGAVIIAAYTAFVGALLFVAG